MSDTTSQDKPVTPYKDLTLVDDRGDFAILTINRPEKRNAMSLDAMERIREALVEVADKKVVILTGTGPSFCAGVDLSDVAHREVEANRSAQELNPWTKVQRDIRQHRAIFIAAVNGYALGGGSTLVNVSDLAIAAESAQIGLPEMGFGGWPMQASPAVIKRLAPKHAAELIVTARRVDAATAYRIALVNKVVPDAELLDEAIALATHIAGFNATALDFGKKAFNRIQELSWDDAQDYSAYTSMISRARDDSAASGMQKFLAGQRGPGQGA